MIEKYVKRKRVAFVGLAPNILNKGLGEEIDNFDIVIRTNLFPIPDDWQNDYGSKCDIFVLHINLTNKKLKGFKNVKAIITYKNVKNKLPKIDYIKADKKHRIEVSEHIKKEIGNPIWGTQGTNMMYYALKGGAREFKFFGVTGYQDKNGNILDHNETNHYIHQRPSKSMKNNPYHNFEVLNNYTRLMLRRGLINMDEYSLKYFV